MEEIHTKIPQGYEKNNNFDKLYKVKKGLYTLKQSARSWFGKFTQTMKKLGCKNYYGYHTLFFQHFPSRGVTILIVHIDDIIVAGNDDKEATKLENHLTKHF